MPGEILVTSFTVICTTTYIQTWISFNFRSKLNVKFNIVSHFDWETRHETDVSFIYDTKDLQETWREGGWPLVPCHLCVHWTICLLRRDAERIFGRCYVFAGRSVWIGAKVSMTLDKIIVLLATVLTIKLLENIILFSLTLSFKIFSLLVYSNKSPIILCKIYLLSSFANTIYEFSKYENKYIA